MFIGFLFAIGACFVWGLIFIVPDYLGDFTPLEVALGRYFSYGILSSVLLFRKGFSEVRRFPLPVWGKALVYGLFSNIFYYVAVIVGLRYATGPVTVLILGTCPILVAFYGNWHVKECSYRSLIIPTLWILFGLILVNISEVDWSFKEYSAQEYLFGLLCVVGALASWSWYAVSNARFLKKNTSVPRSEWSTLIGVGTFTWVLLFGFICCQSGFLDLNKFVPLTNDSLRFLGATAVLGIVCSWLGCFLWNQASSYLPISLMGSFIIFETIFGLMFVYMVNMKMPSVMEMVGIASMLGGILFCVYLFRKKKEVPPVNS